MVTATGDRAVEVFGLAQREPEPVPMRRGTWFDLASLTKVLFTTPTILHLVAQGRIALDDTLTAAIPDLRQYDRGRGERHLTFRQCLSHQTHLPAVEPLYTYGQDPATLRAFILQRVWRAGPAGLFRYQFHAAGHRHRAADRASARRSAVAAQDWRGVRSRPTPRRPSAAPGAAA